MIALIVTFKCNDNRSPKGVTISKKEWLKISDEI